MRADFTAFLHQADSGLRRQLLQPDRGREAGWTAADDHDVELHCLPRGQFVNHCASPRLVRVT